MIALGFLSIALGSAFMYGAIRNQSVLDEVRGAFGLAPLRPTTIDRGTFRVYPHGSRGEDRDGDGLIDDVPAYPERGDPGRDYVPGPGEGSEIV